MLAPECPFQFTIIKEDYACAQADTVSVRNTPKIHCKNETMLEDCRAVYERMKSAGLEAFDVEDDLTTTPHNVYLKIQYGGLESLAGDDPDRLQDIGILIDDAVAFAGADAIDYASMTATMLKVKTRKRRR